MSQDKIMQRVREIAERGRPEPPLSYEEVMERAKEIAVRGREEPLRSYEEVRRRVREIAQGVLSKAERAFRVPSTTRRASDAINRQPTTRAARRAALR